jgi:hypothetical protein
MKYLSPFFLILAFLLVQGTTYAQRTNKDTLIIEEPLVIKAEQSLNWSNYRYILLGPQAIVWIEGSLTIEPGPGLQTIIQSIDPDKQSKGLVITGNLPEGSIVLENVHFNNLDQAVQLEPFWNRGSFKLRNFIVSSCGRNQPSIMVNNPLVNPSRETARIEFSNGTFFNNFSGLFLDNMGGNGTDLSVQDLRFIHNYPGGDEDQIGLLHLGFSNQFNASRSRISGLYFDQNFSDDKPSVDISVSGNSSHSFTISPVWSFKPIQIFDQRKNPRLPKLNCITGTSKSLPPNCSPRLDTNSGNVVRLTNFSSSCGPFKVYSSTGQEVLINSTISGDTLTFEPNATKSPSFLVFQRSQLKVLLRTARTNLSSRPDLIFEEDTILSKADLAVVIEKLKFTPNSVILREGDSLISKQDLQSLIKLQSGDTVLSYNSLQDLTKKIEVLENSTGLVTNLPAFDKEISISRGLAFYVGEIKPKLGVPTYLDFSWSIAYEKKINVLKSIRFEGHYTRIGMLDKTAFLAFGSVRDLNLTANGQRIQIPQAQLGFRTQILGLSFNTIYHFPSAFSKSKNLSLDLGWGVGLIRYDPMRLLSYNKDLAINTDSIAFLSLRSLGSEGQNYQEGSLTLMNTNIDVNLYEYGPYAILLNSLARISYQKLPYRFFAEIKFNLALTDYLDDIGLGKLYGANYNDWLKSNKNYQMPVNPTQVSSSGTPVAYELPKLYSNINSVQRRSTQLLPDGYFQVHFGLAYDLPTLVNEIKKLPVPKIVSKLRKQ